MSVKVAVRCRPRSANEQRDASDIIIRMNDNQVQVVECIGGTGGTFHCDEALWSVGLDVTDSKNPQATQDMVYRSVGSEMLSHVVTGYNGCIFAYGQTGSGKTYSMMGTATDQGIVPRIAKNLFTETKNLSDNGLESCVEVSFFEIYNEKVRCLLRPTDGGFEDSTLRVREHPKFGPFIEGLSKFVVSTEKEFLQLMNDGNKVRTTGATAMNVSSSRSHAVFAVTLTQKRTNGRLVTTKMSRLNLVDLAGSERASKTMATGKRLAEGANINKSLTCLGNVISALAEEQDSGRQRHIPYRDSVLTWILKVNLGGNSKTLMLATISPSVHQYDETMSTLRYAERAKCIVNKAIVNETNNNELIAALQREIEQLKGALQGASDTERARLADELAASEAVQRELQMSLEEKLAETRRNMEEREVYMRQLEEELEAQRAEIQTLRDNNAEKERQIQKLLERIETVQQQFAGSGRSADVESLLEQVAVLESAQNAASNQARHTAARHAIDTVLRSEDLGNVRPKEADGGRITVRALAKAFETRDDAPTRRVAGPAEVLHYDPVAMHVRAFESGHVPASALSPAAADEDDDDELAALLEEGVDENGEDLDLDLDLDLNMDEGQAEAETAVHVEDDAAQEDEDVDLDDDIDLDDLEDLEDLEEAETMAEIEDGDADLTFEEQEEEGEEDGTAADASLNVENVADTEEEFNMYEDQPAAEAVAAATSAAAAAITREQTCMMEDVTEPSTTEAAEGDPQTTLQSASQNEAEQKVVPNLELQKQPQPPQEQEKQHKEKRHGNKHSTASQATVLSPAHGEEIGVLTTLVVPSHAIPNNRYLHEPFRVTKMNDTALIGSKKERIWDVDFFSRRFANLDLAGYMSFEQPASNLYRVERDPVHSRRLTLYFFEAPHPYELELTSSDRRQRFYEVATALRRSSIMWCPSLCPEGEHDVILNIVGTTIDRPNGKTTRAVGETKVMVARMPYEVVDLWHGCFSLKDQPLPHSAAVLGSFLPRNSHEVYVIGVMDIPHSFIGTEDLARYFLNYLGPALHYVLANTAVQSRKRQTNNAIVVIVRRSFIVRVSHVEAVETAPVYKDDVSKGDFTAVGCALHINEAKFCFLLINAKPANCSPSSRAACIRLLMSSFPFADPSIDIGVAFDYLFISGSFNFGADHRDDDMLLAQIRAANVMSDMTEHSASSSLVNAPQPVRIFYSVRPNSCRLDAKNYTTSRAFAVPNAFLSTDVFCQRTFLNVFGEQVRRVQLVLDSLCVSSPSHRIPPVFFPELRIAAEWIDTSPLMMPLTKEGDIYTANGRAIPPLIPTVSNTEFLRLQTITFSVMGLLDPAKKQKDKMVIASAAFSMKNVLQMAQRNKFSIPLYYRGCLVGSLAGSLLLVAYEKNTADLAGMEKVPDTLVVSCYENQILDGRSFTPTVFTQHHAFAFSRRDATVECSRESYELPDPTKWQWINNWRHEVLPNNAEGWSYSEGFDQPFHFLKTKTSIARRRRWTRIMQASDPLTLHHYIMLMNGEEHEGS